MTISIRAQFSSLSLSLMKRALFNRALFMERNPTYNTDYFYYNHCTLWGPFYSDIVFKQWFDDEQPKKKQCKEHQSQKLFLDVVMPYGFEMQDPKKLTSHKIRMFRQILTAPPYFSFIGRERMPDLFLLSVKDRIVISKRMLLLLHLPFVLDINKLILSDWLCLYYRDWRNDIHEVECASLINK